MPEPGFLQQLRGHHVFQVAAAYAVMSWLVIQVVTVIFPVLEFPGWLARTIVVLLLIGFPVSLVLAWAFHSARDARYTGKTWRQSLRFSVGLGMSGALIALAAGWAWWHLDSIQYTERSNGARLSPQSASAKAVGSEPTLKAPEPLNPRSIAVLPFSMLGADDKAAYLGQGISEELLNALSRIDGLEVIGRTSSFRFKDSDLGAREVGRELGARNLLSGVVQRSGDMLRVDVELDDAVTGMRLWSARYDVKMQGLFTLEDSISDAVVTALKVQLSDGGGNGPIFAGTASPQAHDLYLRGMRLTRRTDEASLEKALALFNQAIIEDPNYAAGWAGLARAYVNLADVYRAPFDVLKAMRGAAEKAVALNPGLAEGHLQLGYIAMSYDLDFAKAKRELELAVELQPSLAEAHTMLGLYLLRIERNVSAARRELRIARRLDPLNPWFARWAAYAAIAQGNEADAMLLARRVDRLDPKFAYDGDAVAMVEAAFGYWQACAERYRMQMAPVSLGSPQRAVCEAHIGQVAQARAALASLESKARHRYVDHAYIAAIYVALGNHDRAMAELEQGYRERSAHMNWIWMNPWYRPLHGDPRFEALVRRIAAGGHAGPATAPSNG